MIKSSSLDLSNVRSTIAIQVALTWVPNLTLCVWIFSHRSNTSPWSWLDSDQTRCWRCSREQCRFGFIRYMLHSFRSSCDEGLELLNLRATLFCCTDSLEHLCRFSEDRWPRSRSLGICYMQVKQELCYQECMVSHSRQKNSQLERHYDQQILTTQSELSSILDLDLRWLLLAINFLALRV